MKFHKVSWSTSRFVLWLRNFSHSHFSEWEAELLNNALRKEEKSQEFIQRHCLGKEIIGMSDKDYELQRAITRQDSKGRLLEIYPSVPTLSAPPLHVIKEFRDSVKILQVDPFPNQLGYYRPPKILIPAIIKVIKETETYDKQMHWLRPNTIDFGLFLDGTYETEQSSFTLLVLNVWNMVEYSQHPQLSFVVGYINAPETASGTLANIRIVTNELEKVEEKPVQVAYTSYKTGNKSCGSTWNNPGKEKTISLTVCHRYIADRKMRYLYRNQTQNGTHSVSLKTTASSIQKGLLEPQGRCLLYDWWTLVSLRKNREEEGEKAEQMKTVKSLKEWEEWICTLTDSPQQKGKPYVTNPDEDQEEPVHAHTNTSVKFVKLLIDEALTRQDGNVLVEKIATACISRNDLKALGNTIIAKYGSSEAKKGDGHISLIGRQVCKQLSF